MMNFFDAILLGVIEGLTEFLPVSSTGHMILASNILGIANDPFTKTFEIVIQLAAICAVIFIYWKTVLASRDVMLKIISAFIPTAILGFTLYPFIKEYLFASPLVVVSALFLGGVAIIAFEKISARRTGGIVGNAEAASDVRPGESAAEEKPLKDVTYKKAVLIGLWQSLAMIPGVSRSAATIIGGEVMGISRKTIVEFSFLLAIPTMLGATVLDLYSTDLSFSNQEWQILAVGCIVAFAVAFVAVKSFLKYIQSHSFSAFGYYRILLAVAYALFFL